MLNISVDTTDDKNLINNIIIECDNAFTEPVSKRDIYCELLQKIHEKGIFIFAHCDVPMGYCAFYANDCDTKNAFISLIAVKPECQHMHIGKRLLETCFDIAKGQGMKSCSLEVKKDNLRAINFYEKNGFEFLSERENSFLMNKALL